MVSTHSVIEFLLCITLSALLSEVNTSKIITFQELEDINIKCRILNSCEKRKNTEIHQLSIWTACHCDSLCSQLGTCCLDSPFRKKYRVTEVPSCRYVNGMFQKSYFMIDKCPFNGNANDAFQDQCEEEKNTEGDLMMQVPVTSLSSHLTYKNYFCFRCHETHEDYLFWNVQLVNNCKFNENQLKDVIPTHNKGDEMWWASVGKDGELCPLIISIHAPPEISNLTRRCFPDLISNCSKDAQIGEITRKCGSYMSVITISGSFPRKLYRNPHCALCNFEEIKRYDCLMSDRPSSGGGSGGRGSSGGGSGGRGSSGGGYGRPFSFVFLLDINQSDGRKVGKIKLCNESSTWDPFFKKCRRLTCAVPQYVIRDKKCRAP